MKASFPPPRSKPGGFRARFATPRRSAMVRDALPQVTARPALPFQEILVRGAPTRLSLSGGTMRPGAGNQSAISGGHFRKSCVAEGAIIIIAISIDPPQYYRVGENQPQRHQRDTTDPKSKRFAEYRRGCHGTVGTLPARGIGQAKAEHLPSGTVPNVPPWTKSRSIDFVLLYDLPGGIGLRGSRCFKTGDWAEKEHGAATLGKLT
jgi:hypothetical protein